MTIQKAKETNIPHSLHVNVKVLGIKTPFKLKPKFDAIILDDDMISTPVGLIYIPNNIVATRTFTFLYLAPSILMMMLFLLPSYVASAILMMVGKEIHMGPVLIVWVISTVMQSWFCVKADTAKEMIAVMYDLRELSRYKTPISTMKLGEFTEEVLLEYKKARKQHKKFKKVKSKCADSSIFRDENNVALNGMVYIKNNDEYAYFKNGVYHNDGGPASITKRRTVYYNDSQIHRVDGPSIITAFSKVWYFRGEHADTKSQDEYEKWVISNL